MATHCIPRQSCNSRMVGWIGGGDHPTIAYQKVTRTVYMHHKSSCHYLSYPGTDIRNCSGFYVYKLKSTTTCFQRYCGVNGKCLIKNIIFFSCVAYSIFFFADLFIFILINLFNDYLNTVKKKPLGTKNSNSMTNILRT